MIRGWRPAMSSVTNTFRQTKQDGVDLLELAGQRALAHVLVPWI